MLHNNKSCWSQHRSEVSLYFKQATIRTSTTAFHHSKHNAKINEKSQNISEQAFATSRNTCWRVIGAWQARCASWRSVCGGTTCSWRPCDRPDTAPVGWACARWPCARASYRCYWTSGDTACRPAPARLQPDIHSHSYTANYQNSADYLLYANHLNEVDILVICNLDKN